MHTVPETPDFGGATGDALCDGCSGTLVKIKLDGLMKVDFATHQFLPIVGYGFKKSVVIHGSFALVARF
jgi:hypothetical protein